MEPIRVMVISSVRPEPTSAGQIILHRHLINRPEFNCEIYGGEPAAFHWRIADRRLSGRLGRTCFHRWAMDYGIWRNGRWLDRYLPRGIANKQNTIVLTVAHGDACYAALRYAQSHGLPLVTWFQDWYPDIINAHDACKRLLEKHFRSLYVKSDLVFCICNGMREHLGEHRNAYVLHDMPAILGNIQSKQERDRKYRILYFGNLFEYGPMLGSALELLRHHPQIRLEVRGANPQWPLAFKSEMASRGLWLDFAPRAKLDDWLTTADAFLVPMVFDSSMRRRMETSFPSKLPEFCQFGKPIVVWGPEYCSAVRWAQNGQKAVVVTDQSPNALAVRLLQLAASSADQMRYAETAFRAAGEEFNPVHIHQQFAQAVVSVLNCG